MFDAPWILFLSPIVDEARAGLRDALALNMNLSIGALAIEQRHLVMRAVLPLATVDGATLDKYVSYVVSESLRLRLLHDGIANPGPGDLFRD